MRLLIILFLFLTFSVNAQKGESQQPQRCYATEVHEANYESNSDYRKKFNLRKFQLDSIKRISNFNSKSAFNCTNPVIIPVAVHYEGITSQTAACLETLALSQIQVLNEDFAASNTDIANYCTDVAGSSLDPAALAFNGTCIQFCLADQNHPGGFGLNNGDYAITINEDYVANNSFPNFTLGVWSGYLNIFVTEGTGVLGYAPLFGSGNGDGVVIEACVFGSEANGNVSCGNGVGPGAGCAGYASYNLGRTATHEVGHYLGLPHIWGDGACGVDDGFGDTPTSAAEYYGCPTIGASSCTTDDMYMNYMDYVNDACMYMFSEDQAVLMNNTASNITWGSNKCSATVTYPTAILPVGCVTAALDAGVIAHVSPAPNSSACSAGGSVTPQVTIQNIGSTTLTSATISYEVNGGTAVTYNWTGSLVQAATENVTLPSYTEPAGVYTFESYTSSPNGSADENGSNDGITTNHQTVTAQFIPFSEDFEDASFNPTNSGLTTYNPDSDAFVWVLGNVSANGTGGVSAFFNNYSGSAASNPNGTIDQLRTPIFDFSTTTDATLTFDVAYARYDASFFDGLEVFVSTDCGNTYTTSIYYVEGAALATAPDNTAAFIPTAGDWNNISIDLSAYDNAPTLSIAITNVSSWGNNLFVDNINVTGTTLSTTDINGNFEVSVYPNPTSDYITIKSPSKITEVKMYDMLGKLILTNTKSTDKINVSSLQTGAYILKIYSDKGQQIKRLIIE